MFSPEKILNSLTMTKLGKSFLIIKKKISAKKKIPQIAANYLMLNKENRLF